MNHQTLRILAIDDDRADLRILTSQLRQIGRWECIFWSYTDVHEAMSDLANRQPDIILIDSYIGHERGANVLRVIRETGCRTPAILLSGRGDEQTAADALKAGAADYLNKSELSPQLLEQAILGALEKDRFALYLDEHRRSLSRVNQDLHRRKRSVQTCFEVLATELLKPIGALQEFLDSMVDDNSLSVALADGQLRRLRNAMDSCGGLGRLINQMIENVRLESGQDMVRPEKLAPVGLRPLVEGCLRSLTADIKAAEVKIDAAISPDLPQVLADDTYLPRALADLLSYAVRATPASGQVRLRAAHETEMVVLTITDGDKSMTQVTADEMLDSDASDPSPDRDSPWALGLPLRVARALLRLMDGDLQITADGYGTRLSVRLPVARALAIA